jgi:hypothetical protein
MRNTTSPGASTRTAEATVEELSREVAELRAAVKELASEPRPEAGHSGRRRRGRAHHDGSPESSGLVSRRHLFGLLGGAAAAGAGLAVAGSALSPDRADAVNPPMLLGTPNDAGTASTSLTSNSAAGTLEVDNSGSGAGVLANTFLGSQIPLVAVPPAGVSTLWLDGGAASAGPPTGGFHSRGELYQDQNAALFYCTAKGTPGTWANLSIGERLVTLNAPVRVYDSRFGQPNNSGNGNDQGSITFTNPPPGAAFRTINCANDASSGTAVLPATANALLINLTIVPISGVGALEVYASGAAIQPSASTINWSAGVQVLANAATSACTLVQQGGNARQNVNVAIVATAGASTDFLIDVIGYYM